MNFIYNLFTGPSSETLNFAILFLRISMGILTMLHGVPKMSGGVQGWNNLGITFMYPLGIHFMPVMWGFLGAATEFIGGIMLTFGFATKIVSFCLIMMMIIATLWHVKRGDSFNLYSFPLSLIFVYGFFLLVGGYNYSIDQYLFRLFS